MKESSFTGCYMASMKRALDGVEVTGANGAAMDLDAGFSALCDRTVKIKEAGSLIYFVGNGASAMMSSHMSVDFLKNAGVRSLAFNDPALLTAIGNDLGYQRAFEMPLSALGRRGDMLVTISSSGNSPNVIEGIKAAKNLGISVVTFTGMKPQNQSRAMGDLNFWVPSRTYGVAESVHAILLHCWLDKFMNIRDWEMG